MAPGILIFMLPLLAPVHDPNATALDALRMAESQRLALGAGTLELRWTERRDGVETVTFDAEAFFSGLDKYGMSLRRHSFFRGQPAERRDPQCIQVVNGPTLYGMWYSGPTQRFFADEPRNARLTLFHPFGLGLLAYPLPSSDADTLFFWHGAAARNLDPAPDTNGQRRIAVEGSGRSGPYAAEISIDPSRGWSVTKYTATVGDGCELSVRSAPARFGSHWYPAQAWMSVRFPDGQLTEVYVEVLRAEFGVRLPEGAFSFAALGPPVDGRPKALALDYRVGGGALGWWDGVTLREPSRECRPRP